MDGGAKRCSRGSVIEFRSLSEGGAWHEEKTRTLSEALFGELDATRKETHSQDKHWWKKRASITSFCGLGGGEQALLTQVTQDRADHCGTRPS